MNIQLLIDTSAKYLAIGIAKDNKIVAKTQYEAWQRQSELTIDEINKLFKSTNIKPKEVTRVIVANGPGSYTGVRIGLTIAKIFATSLNIPLCLVSSLNMIAGINGKKIALIDARSKRAYIGVYNNGVKVIDDTVMTLTEVEGLMEKYPDYELVGDTHLLNKEKQEIDLITNLLNLSSIIKDIENPHLAIPVYLKD
jgi:tRNA threonylcarbamoyl adenosine modification protein YeaZ